MSALRKKPTIPRQSSDNSLVPTSDPSLSLPLQHHNRSNSEGNPQTPFSQISPTFPNNSDGWDKVNRLGSEESHDDSKNKRAQKEEDKENLVPSNSGSGSDVKLKEKRLFLKERRALKPSSLQLCMQLDDPGSVFRSKVWGSEGSNSVNIWDHSDSEAAPASSWFTLPNRTLLCKPLPVDIGRCTCIIVKEASTKEFGGGTLYSLYTSEGQGRQNRKLAVAYHKRHNGHSKFFIAQNLKGTSFKSDDSFRCSLTANLMGSKYYIWDQDSLPSSHSNHSKKLQALVAFMPTISTWTGSHRSMRVWIPKKQPLKQRSSKPKHVNGLYKGREGKVENCYLLHSRVPQYNKVSKQYELDFRETGRGGLRIQSSVKNFQLMDEKGRQILLQMGRVEKSKYLVDYRYPLAGYEAFCICLASIDSKLCCTV
ncbi:hypothetical protein Dimus_027321 [Dionaea muscipula]